ncbi:MAG: glycoside hydrolase family 97 protein [Alistipes sp.]|nr:glycoside hydrolase family 97 protein [Alistipes sp.]
MRRLLTICVMMLLCFSVEAQTATAICVDKGVCVTSPSENNSILLDLDKRELKWSASHCGVEVVAPSRLSMTTSRGTWGVGYDKARVKYRQTDEYNSAVVKFDGYALELRAYDEGVAYRFISNCRGEYEVVDEVAEFAFVGDDMAWVPYTNYRPDATTDYATQYETSFENIYDYTTIKDIDWRRLIFAPVVVERNGLKLWISEANLEDYPGMFFSNRDGDGVLDTEFAPRPKDVEQGGHNMLQGMVKSRHAYIAKCDGGRAFPWRMVAIGEDDRSLAEQNLVWRLADDSRIKDTSWIEGGKVAWEWWNDWGLEGVDFEVGINNETYKYYIDFASRYGIEYVILDEGWSVNLEADLMQVVPEIDIKELVDYAKVRNVGIILWAGYWALNRDIEGICKHYAEMGVKGFKVDFLDRDDQEMVEFVYDLAEIASKYKLLVDYHGVYKPTGLNRTYPNAINFEGVHGLETMKWLGVEHDQITYDVTIPFIRGTAGPMDYTQGAMRNAHIGDYRPDYSRPMSQGTRCHQLAMYVVYDAPLTMLCDSPTNYEREPDYTRFVAQMPTTWSTKECLEGAIGEYIVMRRECDDAIYIAGLNGNTAREVVLTLEGEKYSQIEIYFDDESVASKYQYSTIADGELRVWMSAGGGFVVKMKR